MLHRGCSWGTESILEIRRRLSIWELNGPALQVSPEGTARLCSGDSNGPLGPARSCLSKRPNRHATKLQLPTFSHLTSGVGRGLIRLTISRYSNASSRDDAVAFVCGSANLDECASLRGGASMSAALAELGVAGHLSAEWCLRSKRLLLELALPASDIAAYDQRARGPHSGYRHAQPDFAAKSTCGANRPE